MKGLSIQVKAVALLTALALVPVVVVIALILPGYGEAVRVRERQYQLVVLNRITGLVERRIGMARLDAAAVATALANASTASMKDRQDDALGSVRAVLANREFIDAARFEVPSAGVSTVLTRYGAEPRDVPSSTPELRLEADEHGIGFVVSEPDRATIVVPIRTPPSPPGEPGGQTAPKAAKGYVTVAVYLTPLAEDLDALAQASDLDEASTYLVIVDSRRRVVATNKAASAAPGTDVSSLPVWAVLPQGITRSMPIGVTGEYVQDGVAMVGSVHTVQEIGWAVAIWRPQAIAMSEYLRVRRLMAVVAGGALLLALVAGFIAAKAVTRPVLDITAQAQRIGKRQWSELLPPPARGDELGELGRSIVKMADDLQKGEIEALHQAKLRGDLSRFMSKDLVDAIVRGEHSLALGGTRMSVSVVFADVVAFTPLAESRPAEAVVAILNELFSVLTEVVFRHGGTVDKFVGDCIMAVWGAPVPVPDHAARALAAAEDMMRFLETASAEWRKKYDVEIRLGVGVNSGEAIVGNIGSDKRMEYTVIGDVVNVAARLEAIAAPNQVLVSAATRDMVGDAFSMRLLGERSLTGRKQATKVYELDTA